MSDPRHGFDEAQLSGYIDGELTQGEEQRVRLHLEDCVECRNATDELRRLKEATMTTKFKVPEDTQWDEAPRGTVSRLLRNFGWLIALAWAVGILGYGLWRAAADSTDLFEVVAVFGFWLALALIFLSVLIDRIRTLKTDRYRRVQK